jgi:hypothetical protein
MAISTHALRKLDFEFDSSKEVYEENLIEETWKRDNIHVVKRNEIMNVHMIVEGVELDFPGIKDARSLHNLIKFLDLEIV